ncbi:LysR family transcriptional regulator [uncultured Ruegeria sp.]|uniref:LysR family transcriptional regulator n=1 Tax=uncultured Ruegeria sp. TaxID=259304 RepID=UPI00261403C0|nr:LysR family transcriptional regulator [uncultured Ruegeria sp.]
MGKQLHRLKELESLRAFVTTGTTIGAAQRLGISQSAVSRCLSQLEARVGRSLFVRTSGRIEPTEEALTLDGMLDPIFKTLAQIDGSVWADPADQPLKLVVPPTLAHNFVTSRLAGFLQKNPSKQIHLDVQSTDVLVLGILDRRYDLGITTGMIHHAGVQLVSWRRSQIICAMPEGHRLAALNTVSPEDLDGERTITLSHRLGTRPLTDRILARSGVTTYPVAETSTSLAALQLAKAGLGVTLLNPFPLLTGVFPGICVRPFDADIVYESSFVMPAGRTPSEIARQFMRYVKLTTPPDPYSTSI